LAVTTPDAGDDSIDSDFDDSPCSYDISVFNGQVVTRDLGLVGTTIDPGGVQNQISGTVWKDANQNTRIDDDESGVVTVVGIYALPEQVGSFVQHIVTDQNGMYTFKNLPDGDYRVVVNEYLEEKASVFSLATSLLEVPRSGVITNISANSSVHIDFPVDEIVGVIKVDGISCTLVNALLLSRYDEKKGGCLGEAGGAIVLEPGSDHRLGGFPRGRGFKNIIITIYGNGASIDRITSGASGSPTGRVHLINVSIKLVHSGTSTFFLSHSDVDRVDSTHDANAVQLSYSKIRYISGNFSTDYFLFSSVVTGDASLRQTRHSKIEGTLKANLFGSEITESSVNKLIIRKVNSSKHIIKNTTIGGIFINGFTYTSPFPFQNEAGTVDECFNDERILDPQCLLDFIDGG
jgi:hypothetical protein